MCSRVVQSPGKQVWGMGVLRGAPRKHSTPVRERQPRLCQPWSWLQSSSRIHRRRGREHRWCWRKQGSFLPRDTDSVWNWGWESSLLQQYPGLAWAEPGREKHRRGQKAGAAPGQEQLPILGKIPSDLDVARASEISHLLPPSISPKS